MDERIKALLRELGEAINDAVTQSTRVAEVMQAIRGHGHEIALTLDANMAIAETAAPDGEPARTAEISSDDLLTEDDQRFLRRLKIGY